MKVWEDIETRWDAPPDPEKDEIGRPEKSGRAKLFEAREVERDSSFLRRYLTEELIREEFGRIGRARNGRVSRILPNARTACAPPLSSARKTGY